MTTNVDLKTLLDGFNTTRSIMLQDMFSKATPGVYSDYTEVKDAGGARTLEWAFIANIPRMRAWIGARQKKAPRGYSSSVSWASYESTLILNYKDLQYDLTGVVNDAVQQHLKNTIDFYDEVVHTAYNSNSGAGPTCYDGTALFNTSHPHGPSAGTQSNYGSTNALTDANIKAAIIVGNGLQEENGRTLKVNYSELHIGPKQQFVAEELFNSTRAIVYGSNTAATTLDNVLSQRGFRVVVDDRDTTFYWTLRDPNMPKPMILLVGQAPMAAERTDLTDEPRWERNEVEFGIEADVGAAALAWQGVYRAVPTS